jgi:hypothetical protein
MSHKMSATKRLASVFLVIALAWGSATFRTVDDATQFLNTLPEYSAKSAKVIEDSQGDVVVIFSRKHIVAPPPADSTPSAEQE